MHPYIMGLLGGAMIGTALSLWLWFSGRIAGSSGVIHFAIHGDSDGRLWRISFLIGMVGASVVGSLVEPDLVVFGIERSWAAIGVAGLLVGFGTRMSSGCTSGHGVCGVSRPAPRSIAATVTFMVAGMLVVAAIRNL